MPVVQVEGATRAVTSKGKPARVCSAAPERMRTEGMSAAERDWAAERDRLRDARDAQRDRYEELKQRIDEGDEASAAFTVSAPTLSGCSSSALCA